MLTKRKLEQLYQYQTQEKRQNIKKNYRGERRHFRLIIIGSIDPEEKFLNFNASNSEICETETNKTDQRNRKSIIKF